MNTRLPDRGFSITELLLVVAVIAVISAIAVPAFSTLRERRLEFATAEVMSALRFARQESIRTGIPHGVRKIAAKNGFSVFRMDLATLPPNEVHDVRHPVNRAHLYQIDLGANSKSLSTSIIAHFKIFGDPVTQEAISFNARGEPIDGVTGRTLGVPQGGFLINNGNLGTSVTLSWLGGRLTRSAIRGAKTDPITEF